MNTHYASSLTLRAARDLYFAANKFGADGGYSSPWVDLKLGPIPMPFPNSPGRVRAVRRDVSHACGLRLAALTRGPHVHL